MMPIFNRPIATPTLDANRNPLVFIWRGGRYRVTAILDVFKMTERWWEQDPERTYYRVQDQHLGVWELAKDSKGQWWLYKGYD